ncbi:tyrosine-type recombinase/integrase [Candidatus Protochlamydia phocaeensis]|uniref:tyrosine-type recombinase/integrase n=1 Tax=Candidatus Protochlamydia phocaeensis TaxID=1414722 RepID=UPI00083884E1|nr:site-specific integrase [Candidatus Protochlamydia phocaeensis]
MGTIRELTKKNGEKSYHAEVRLKGFPSQRESFRTRTQAKKWIQDTEAAIRDGRFKNQSASRKYLVKELIDRFIAQCLPKHPKYYVKKVGLLSKWKEELGDVLLANLSPSHIATVRDKLLSEKTSKNKLRSPSTVNRYIAAFSKALSVAVKEWEWILENPVEKITKPKESRGRDRFLSLDEKDSLLKACKASSNPYLYSIVAIALMTAMRYGEIINLKWKDIDFEQRLITLHETKNGEKRFIPLTEEIISILKKCPTYGSEPISFIFQSFKIIQSNQPISIRKSFARALKEAGISSFRFHDLRHTAASYLAMNGATQGELMAILGHRSPQMTRRYAHFSQQHIANLLQKNNHTILKEKENE